MKKTLLFVILMSVAVCTFATNVVSQEDAKIAAKNFMIELCQKENISLDFFTLSEIVTDANGEALYYNFDMANTGFILVSATNLIAPVLAYSFESRFEENEWTSFFVEKYKTAIQTVKANPELQEISAVADWNRYLASDFTPVKTRATTLVEPLVSTKWTQEKYYNQYCPYDPEAPIIGVPEDLRTVVGCVALTMTNLMYYYRYPSTLSIGAGYYHPKYGRLTVERGQNYNYDYIAHDNFSAYQHDFAKLIYHAGITVEMGYGGANGSGTTSEKVGNRMRSHWGFYPGNFTRRKDGGEEISYPNWEKEIISELEAQRPIFYSGHTTPESGHAWIIDGYIKHSDGKNYFHANWGWYGQSNGFFKIDALRTPQGTFSNFQEGFFKRLAPDSTALVKPNSINKRLTAFRGNISDGAGSAGYPLKAEYKWTIATPGAKSYVLTPKKIKILADDYIAIYAYRNGQLVAVPVDTWQGEFLMPGCADRGGTINISFAGTPLPSPLTVQADSVLVAFYSTTEPDSNTFLSSDIARRFTGININYYAKYPNGEPAQYCNSSNPININDKTPFTISDKTVAGIEQNTPYRAETVCAWTIRLDANNPELTAVRFKFEEFNLGIGDVIDIYSAALSSTNPKPALLHRFDKSNQPIIGKEYYHGGKMLHLRFNVDNYDEGTGFVLKCNGYDNTGIDPRYAGLNDLSVYPNPTSDKLYAEFRTNEAGKITFQILDLTGRVITTETVNHVGGELKHETSVAGLAVGMYFLNVSSEKGAVTHKFIVK